MTTKKEELRGIVRVATIVLMGIVFFISTGNFARAAGEERIGYYGSWDIYGNNYLLKNVDTSGAASKLTTLVYSFENIDPSNLTCFQTISAADTDDSNPNAGDGAGDAWADYQRPFSASEAVSGVADASTTQTLMGNFNQLKELKAKYPNLKIFLSIGGWTYSKYFSDAASTSVSRAAFVSSCIDMYIKGNLPTGIAGDTVTGGTGVGAGIFDGLDIDWEFPGSANGHTGNHYDPADTANYTALLAEFRSQLNTQGTIDGKHYYLTATIPSGPNDIALIDPNIKSSLDWASIMAYDFHGAWETTGPTNFQSALYPSANDPSIALEFTVSQAADNWVTAGIPKSQLVIGVPFYWRGWTGVSAGANHGLYQTAASSSPAFTYSAQAGTAQYRELLGAGILANTFLDFLSRGTWAYNGTDFYTGDTPNALNEKGAYITTQGYHGAMIYSLEDDDSSGTLLSSVVAGLNGGTPPPPPLLSIVQTLGRTAPSAQYTATNAEPINMIGGNYLITRNELHVAGREDSPVDFSLTYNSAAASVASQVGWGWTYNYRITAVTDTDGSVVVQNPDGRLDRFTPDGIGGYTAPEGIYDTLASSSGHFIVTHKDKSVYNFNSAGLISTIVSANGNTQTLAYDANNLLTTLTDSVGRTFTFTYNDNNQLVTVTDPASRTVNYAYDLLGNLVSVTNPLSQVTHYTYDNNHRILTVVDPRGNTVITNVYDGDGRVTQQTDALSHSVTLSYSSGSTTFTDARSHATVYSYDSHMRLTQITDALSGVTSFTYDANGNLATTTDALSHATGRSYDSHGNITRIGNAIGGAQTFTYDGSDNLLTHTDELGHVTTYTYDAHGNVKKVVDPTYATTTIGYDTHGQATSTTDALSHITKFAYDSSGNLTTKTDAANRDTDYGYDSVGRLTTVDDASSDEIEYTLDAMDHVTRIDDAEGGVTTFTYDADGNKLTATDANSHTTTYAYDANNNITSVTDALGKVTTYTYDANNNLATKTDAKGNVTTYTYDALNRQTQVSDPLSKVTQAGYDAVGNATSRVDASSRTTTYSYDGLNRLTTTTYPNSTTITNTYNAVGDITQAVSSAGTATYTYDADDRVKIATDPNSNVVTYTYDLAGNVTQLKYPDNKTVTYTYNAANQILTEKDWNTSQTTYTYDGNGLLLTKTLPNTIKGTYSYDGNGKLLSLVYKKGASSLTRYDYDRDDVGNITDDEETKGASSFYSGYTYDANNQLTLDDAPSDTYRYFYDAVGNIATSSTDTATTTYTYNANNQLLAKAGRTFTYDNQGNEVTDASTTLAYNYDNQMTSYSTLSGVSTSTTNTVYADSTTWNNWSWSTTVSFTEAATVFSGTKSIKATYTAAFGGMYLEKSATGINVSTSTALQFAIRSTSGTPTVELDAYGANDVLVGYVLVNTYVPGGTLANNTWYNVTVPISAFGATSTISGLSFARSNTGIIYYDDIKTIAVGAITATSTYTYDATGQRLGKGLNGTSTYQYVNTGSEQLLVAKNLASSTLTSYYVYSGTDLISQGSTATTSRQYYLTDGLGNVRYVTDSSGNTIASYSYDPYGNIISGTPGTFNFQEQQRDSESNLTYLRARYYDPTIGRFTSHDPISGTLGNPARQNGYNYTNNDPINLSDPTGMSPEIWGSLPQPNISGSYSDVFLGIIGRMGNAGSGSYQSIDPELLNPYGFTQENLLSQTANPALQKIVTTLFKSTDKLPGGTAGALRYNSLTDELVGGSTHFQAAIDRANSLRNFIQATADNPKDVELAKVLIMDLEEAIQAAL